MPTLTSVCGLVLFTTTFLSVNWSLFTFAHEDPHVHVLVRWTLPLEESSIVVEIAIGEDPAIMTFQMFLIVEHLHHEDFISSRLFLLESE